MTERSRKSTRKRLTIRPTLRHSTVRRTTVVAPVAIQYSPHQIQEGFDFDLHELSVDDVQFINDTYQNHQYENEFHRQISNMIASHGVKAAADGDLEHIDRLLNRVAEFAANTRVHTHDLVKVCAADGWNMLHAAIVYKRVDVINKILEYGTEIIHDPVDDEMEDTPLILAIKNFTSFLSPYDLTSDSPANLQVIKLLLDFGADVNVANKKGDTPLMYAVKIQLPEVVTMLTKREMDVNVDVKNAIGTTALHYAAAFDNKEIATILLQLNADIFIADRSGKTAIHIACKYGSRNVLKLMMEKYHRHVDRIVHDTDLQGNTPLMLAKSASNYSPHNVELLMDRGSNLLKFNFNQNRVLHFYSSVDDKEINEAILHREPTLLQQINSDNETALHIAAKYGHKDTCFLYAEKGADIYAQDSSGFTPMMNAIAHGHKEVIKVLFSFAHSVDVVVKRGKMLLEWAIENGHVSLVEAMTDHDPVSVLDNTYKGSNIIHYVCKLGNAPILQYLLKWDESRNIARTVTTSDSMFGNGYYPLHIAVDNGHMECVKLLCKYTTDIKVRIFEEDTALHIAARNNYLEILKLLLSHGLDPELSNNTEGTVLASAAHAGKDHIVAYLLSIGASPNGCIERYNLKNTPLLLAAKNGHRKVVKLLLEDVVDVSFATEDGHNCLVVAILNGHRSTALTILNSQYWKIAMQFQTKENETPMRLLIQYMPDVAELALHRCAQRTYTTEEKGTNDIHEITYSYEFLDDFLTPRPTFNSFMADIFQWKSKDKDDKMVAVRTDEIPLTYIPPKSAPTVHDSQLLHGDGESVKDDKPVLECEDHNSWLQEKFVLNNHPLELMIQHKRTGLLQTPVVAEMLNHKWKTFVLPVFLANILLRILFVALFTAVVLVGPFPQSDMCNARGCWSAWSSWGSCFDLTGCSNGFTGTMNRTRTCTKGYGIFDDCDGSSLDERSCDEIDFTSGYIKVDPPHQIAEETESTRLECTVIRKTGVPFYVEWMSINGTGLSNESSPDELLNGTVTLPLVFDSVMSEDYQTYICTGREEDIEEPFVNAMAILTSFECQDQCHYNLARKKGESCEERGLENSTVAFLITADVLIILVAMTHLLFQIFKFWRRKLQYIPDLENWLALIIDVLSIAFVLSHLVSECQCANRHAWMVGS